MSKIRNVYVPRWVPWFMLVIVGLTWLWTTYRVFWQGGSEDLGVGGWILMSLMMLAVLVLVFLLGYRKLPAYQIEEDEDA